MWPALFNLGQLQINRDNFTSWPSSVELKKILYAVWWKLPQTGPVADNRPHCMDLNSVSVRNELGNTPPILPPILNTVSVPLLLPWGKVSVKHTVFELLTHENNETTATSQLQVSKFTAICYTVKENVHTLMRMLLSFNTLRMRKDIKYPIYITCVCFRALIFNHKACTLLSSPLSAHFSKKRISTSEEDEDK